MDVATLGELLHETADAPSPLRAEPPPTKLVGLVRRLPECPSGRTGTQTRPSKTAGTYMEDVLGVR